MIDYINKFEMQKLQYSYKEGGKTRGYVSSCLKSILFGKVRYYKQGFGTLLNDYYHTLTEQYNDVSQMENLTYDILIAGSDQIWNSEITNNTLDKAFLLQFGNARKRISVASSIGSQKLTEQDKIIFQEAFKNFSAISVREEFAREQLQPLTSLPIKVIADPTFLLCKDEWKKLAKENSQYYSINQKYILTYFVSVDKRSKRYVDLIKSYSKKLNLPVWAIQFSSYQNKACDKKILGVSVADFIALISNAELVITDSFHGTAISVNLNTDFVAIENKGNPERTKNLLGKLGLLDRINLDVGLYSKIDYTTVNRDIEKLRTETKEWITDAIL